MSIPLAESRELSLVWRRGILDGMKIETGALVGKHVRAAETLVVMVEGL